MTLNDLEWLEWPFYVICSLYYELPLTHYLSDLFIVVCLLHVSSGKVQEANSDPRVAEYLESAENLRIYLPWTLYRRNLNK